MNADRLANTTEPTAPMDQSSCCSNLQHVYFFVSTKSVEDVAQEDNTSALSSNTTSTFRSRNSQQGSTDSSITATTTSTSHSDMNPLAKEFTPREYSTIITSHQLEASDLFELRKTTDKGFGLFAASFISLGTQIICEEPLLKINENGVHHVWGPYQCLDNTKKAIYDNLHSFAAPKLQLHEASRYYLIDPNDDSLDKDDIEECVAEHVRVMRIFAGNNFLLRPNGCAVYATASRLNHSCTPNVHHSYNSTLKSITVHAVRDIIPGEELFSTYLGGKGMYMTRDQRNEELGINYDFTCHCSACMDTTGKSDHMRELMNNVAWGLSQFNQGARGQNPFIPTNASMALLQAEDLLSLMLMEGIVTIELTKAYRSASMYALQCGDFDKSLEYGHNEQAIEKNCLGTALNDMRKNGVAAEIWIAKIYDEITRQSGSESADRYRAVWRGEKKKQKKASWSKASKGKKRSSGADGEDGGVKG